MQKYNIPNGMGDVITVVPSDGRYPEGDVTLVLDTDAGEHLEITLPRIVKGELIAALKEA